MEIVIDLFYIIEKCFLGALWSFFFSFLVRIEWKRNTHPNTQQAAVTQIESCLKSKQGAVFVACLPVLSLWWKLKFPFCFWYCNPFEHGKPNSGAFQLGIKSHGSPEIFPHQISIVRTGLVNHLASSGDWTERLLYSISLWHVDSCLALSDYTAYMQFRYNKLQS